MLPPLPWLQPPAAPPHLVCFAVFVTVVVRPPLLLFQSFRRLGCLLLLPLSQACSGGCGGEWNTGEYRREAVPETLPAPDGSAAAGTRSPPTNPPGSAFQKP
jgi:hypothetical protein